MWWMPMCHHHLPREREALGEPIAEVEEPTDEAEPDPEADPALESADGRVFVPPADD